MKIDPKNVKWWQVLLLVGGAAGVTYFKTMRRDKLEGKDIGARLDELRFAACKCADEPCRDGVRGKIAAYLEEIKNDEILEDKVALMKSKLDSAATCLSAPLPDPADAL